MGAQAEAQGLQVVASEEIAAGTAAEADALQQDRLAMSEARAGAGGRGGGAFGKAGALAFGLGSAFSGVQDAAGGHFGAMDALGNVGAGALIGFEFGGGPGAAIGAAIGAGISMGEFVYSKNKNSGETNKQGYVSPKMAVGGTVYPDGRIVHLAENGEPEDVVPHSKRSSYAAAIGGEIHPALLAALATPPAPITVHVNGANLDEKTLARELDRIQRSAAARRLRTVRVSP